MSDADFEKLLDKYYDMFDENYPLDITSTLSTDEHVRRIKTALESNKPVREQYMENVTY